MKPANLLIILSDQHNPRAMGCAGHSLVKTPHIDALAARGTRFSSAYTNCPICVPARASLATGRHVHQTRFWDNAIAYDGSVPNCTMSIPTRRAMVFQGKSCPCIWPMAMAMATWRTSSAIRWNDSAAGTP